MQKEHALDHINHNEWVQIFYVLSNENDEKIVFCAFLEYKHHIT